MRGDTLPLPTRRMLTDREAAEYCGFPSVATFKARVRAPAVDYGKFVRYDRQRLDEWLDTLSEMDADGDDIVRAAGNESRPRARA